MSNYVMNKLTLSGNKEDIDALLAVVKGDNGLFDFNKVVPMPEELDIPSSNGEEFRKIAAVLGGFDRVTDDAIEEYVPAGADHDSAVEHLKLERQLLLNRQKYGYYCQYDWRICNWDTNRNAYEPEVIDGHIITFKSAWSSVCSVVAELSKMFPRLEFTYQYADEDVGHYVGKQEYYCGVLVFDSTFTDKSKEAYENYAETWGHNLEDMDCVYDAEQRTYVRKIESS